MSSFMSISTLCLLPCALPLTVAQLFLVRRMSVFLASEFPEDPLFILRSGWPFLLAYYIVATLIVFFLWKALKVSRFAFSTKHRIITAAVLAAIFTPSEVSDFFLFNLPGPAAAGLLMLLIGLAFAAPSNSAALLDSHLWVMIGSYYCLPLLVVFLFAYFALCIYSRSHPRVTSNA
jgi:hypothetical protein